MSVTVGFNRREAALLEAMQAELDMSDEAIVRAALRLYQSVHERAKRGERMAWVDASGTLIPEEVGGCMGDDAPESPTPKEC